MRGHLRFLPPPFQLRNTLVTFHSTLYNLKLKTSLSKMQINNTQCFIPQLLLLAFLADIFRSTTSDKMDKHSLRDVQCSIVQISPNFMKGSAYYAETSVSVYQTTNCHISEGGYLDGRRRSKSKFHFILSFRTTI
jgi:hypothetical protein